MNVENSTEFLKSTTPNSLKKQLLFNLISKEKSPKYLAELMEISAKLADENWQRNQVWKPQTKCQRILSSTFLLSQVKFTVELMPKHLIKNAVDYLQKTTEYFLVYTVFETV